MIKAIQTSYAGCRFRSRLEARWAVYFDRLGIDWDYEIEGFVMRNRLGLFDFPESFAYLPDFWLPERQLWVEVKGEWTPEAAHKSLNAAALFGDLVVLGTPPRSVFRSTGVRLHFHKGDLFATPWYGRSKVEHPAVDWDRYVASDFGEVAPLAYDLNAMRADLSLAGADKAALLTARSARFEHGESGATL